ncbi:MAG: hypothetical protein IJC66_11860 [Kiritimatiellae bacterium]|nr:hypothetical protein [Kiritimatiellia bacterium]
MVRRVCARNEDGTIRIKKLCYALRAASPVPSGANVKVPFGVRKVVCIILSAQGLKR